MWERLIARYAWLNPLHPIVHRDSRWMHPELPPFLRRLSNPWTMLGYAAIVHGVLFVTSILTYNHLNMSLASVLLPALSPFLTPFGTPIAAGILHSILYWAMLIGAANQATNATAREFESGSWQILRLTPYPPHQLLLAKLASVLHNWTAVLRTLFIIRISALVVIPIAIASQRGRESTSIGSLDLIGAGMFLAQPYVEIFMVIGLSLLIGMVIRNTLWARIYSYGTVAVLLGVFYTISSYWIMFTTPLGALGGLLVPLGHWIPLAGATLPPYTQVMYTYQTILMMTVNIGLPLLIGVGTVAIALRLAKKDI